MHNIKYNNFIFNEKYPSLDSNPEAFKLRIKYYHVKYADRLPAKSYVLGSSPDFSIFRSTAKIDFIWSLYQAVRLSLK